MNRRLKKKIWICGDVWMDILPSFDHAQLGLKMALLSDRFDILVDTHFDGKTELTIWKLILISKEDKGPNAKLSVQIVDGTFVQFPFPDHSLPNKIRFKHLQIEYIDHSVIAFLRSNKHIWDRMGTKLTLWPYKSDDEQPIWDVLASVWPIFATNIHHLSFVSGNGLDALRRRISPTILTDCNQQLNSIEIHFLYSDAIDDDRYDGPSTISAAGQMLSNWLHTPSKNGQPKRLYCPDYIGRPNLELVNNLKEAFLRATSSASYIIRIDRVRAIPIEPFESVNERTKEKLKFESVSRLYVLLKRCPITAAVQWENDKNLDANLNNVRFVLKRGIRSIGPLSPPAEEEADQSNQNVV